MPQPLLVERALALVPHSDEYLPLIDVIIGASTADRHKLWSRSGEYSTVSKRVLDAATLREQVPVLAERARQRLERLFTQIVRAVEAQQAGNPAEAAEALIEAGETEEAGRWLDKAEQLYLLALQIAADLHDNGPQILALRRLGRVARSSGRLPEAWERYQESHDLAEASMDTAGQVIACQGLGNVCDDRGQRVQAREWYRRGLALAEGLSRPDLIWPFHTNLAALAIQDGDVEVAEAELARAREAIETADNPGALLFWYNNRGLLAQRQNDPAAAERIYREGLERSENPFWEVRLRINLGQSLVPQGRLFEAAEQARLAEEAAIPNRLIPFLVDVYVLLGAIARAQCDEDGFIFFEQALEVCREQGLPSVRRAAIYHDYGRFLGACGRSAEGAAHLEHARDLYRELGLPNEEARVEADLASAQPSPAPPSQAKLA